MNPFALARRAVAAGNPIPVDVAVRLMAQGVIVGELEERLRNTVEQQPKGEAVQ